MQKDLYDVLGVTPEVSCWLVMLGIKLLHSYLVHCQASDDDIKRAYRRLSMTFHPDRWLDVAEKQAANAHWLNISAAYDVLADRSKVRLRCHLLLSVHRADRLLMLQRMVYDEVGLQHMEQVRQFD